MRDQMILCPDCKKLFSPKSIREWYCKECKQKRKDKADTRHSWRVWKKKHQKIGG